MSHKESIAKPGETQMKIRIGTRLLVTDVKGKNHACKIVKIEQGRAEYDCVNPADPHKGGFVVAMLPRLSKVVQVVAY
jgi:hypothetical protein